MGITYRHKGMFTHSTFFATGPDGSAPGLTWRYQLVISFEDGYWPEQRFALKLLRRSIIFSLHGMKKALMPLVVWVFEKIQRQVVLKARPLPHYTAGAHPSLSSKHVVSEKEQSPEVRRQLSTHKQALLAITCNVRLIITVMKWHKISLSHNRVWEHTKITTL